MATSNANTPAAEVNTIGPMNASTQKEQSTGQTTDRLHQNTATNACDAEDHETVIVDMVREISRQTQP